uniref:NAD(P)-dependent oxidoreductase n=1 Tax=uncultured Sphingomonas sp. TaxID=158754 RepID=UPI0035C9B602
MQIGFIGLGKMGSAMAVNLVKAGHQVRAWNRSPVDPAEIPGVEIADSVAAALQCEAVFTMLADDAAIRSVLLDSGALDGASTRLIHVVTATISVAFSKELAAEHARRGLAYVAAPVFGRPDAAAAAQLNVVVAGPEAAIATITPLLDAISRKVWPLGSNPAQANAAKIAGNMMITMAIEAMAEGVALAGDNDVPPDTFLELMLGTLFGARAYESYAPKIVSGDFTPGFKMQLGLKDLRLATELADAAHIRLPVLDAIRTRMGDAVEAGMGEQDWSAIASRPYARKD